MSSNAGKGQRHAGKTSQTLREPRYSTAPLRDSRKLNCPRDDIAREIVDCQITWFMVTFRAYHLLPLRPSLLHGGCQIRNRFYPKPRVALRKSPQPLRCNPIIVEQIYSQGNDGSGIRPAPAHAALLHATVDHQGHLTLDHASANWIALAFPPFIRANPGTLVFQIADRLLEGFE